ncbi:MAG: hypothetical protein LUO91_02020 [Methanomicrobiales archaeon]|nr:hypothetical protein [Methanomicrobiales archaeon]
MRQGKARHVQCLGLLFLFAMVVMPAAAQMELVVEPAALTISETQPYMVVFGIPLTRHPAPENATEQPKPSDTSVTRTLTVWVAQNITGVGVRSSDLLRDDGAYAILSSAVNATVPEADLQDDGMASVPVSFELGGVHSGKFTGNLLVTYLGQEQTRGTVKVPVTVNMKDGPVGPVIVLLIGVLLGAGLSHYRAKGKKGDEVRRLYDTLAEIRTNDTVYMNLDPRLFFRTGIDRDMEKTVDRLAVADAEGAEAAIKNAWATWDHWKDYKDRLPSLVQWCTDLRKELDDMEARLIGWDQEREKARLPKIGPFQYLPESRRLLTELYTTLLKPVDFKEFQDAFKRTETGLTARQSSFDSFEQAVNLLRAQEPKAGEGRDPEKDEKLTGFWLRLKSLTQDQDISVLKGDISKEFPGVSLKMKPPRQHEAEVKEPDWWNRFGRRWGLRFSWAAVRLGIFGVLVFALLVLVLLITGYKELYLANPTFGAGAGDYFAIFLWGLGTAPGSEAAIKAVADKFG